MKGSIKTMFFVALCILAAAAASSGAAAAEFRQDIGAHVHIDIKVPDIPAENYPVYQVQYLDLTEQELLNVHQMAELLFHDQQAAQTYKSRRDPEYREGYDEIINAAGERVSVSQNGTITYHHTSDNSRYDRALRYIERCYYYYDTPGLVLDESRIQANLPFASRGEAQALIAPIAAYISDAVGLEPKEIKCLAISHALLKESQDHYTRVEKLDSAWQKKFFPAQWSIDDDLYMFYGSFMQNNLPVYGAYDHDRTIIGQFEATHSPIYIRAGVDASGVVFLEARVMRLKASDQPTAPVFSADEALERFTAYLGKLSFDYPITMNSMDLRYIPIRSKSSFWAGTLVPVWCFGGSGLIEDQWETTEVFLLNARTGQWLHN